VLLKEILALLSKNARKLRLRIRFHPADDRKRYDALLKRFPSVTVEKSNEKDIAADLARARVVVGNQTVAMAVSALARIPTASILPLSTIPSLPFPNITHGHSVRVIFPIIKKYYKIPSAS
jgi:ADP-heptose:LPS heptosyltransferase